MKDESWLDRAIRLFYPMHYAAQETVERRIEGAERQRVEYLRKRKEEDKLLGEIMSEVKKHNSALAVQVGGSHYKKCAIQPVEYIEANQLGFLEGAVVKRVTRHNKSTGKGEQDIDKAIHELQLLKELRYGKNKAAEQSEVTGRPTPENSSIEQFIDWQDKQTAPAKDKFFPQPPKPPKFTLPESKLHENISEVGKWDSTRARLDGVTFYRDGEPCVIAIRDDDTLAVTVDGSVYRNGQKLEGVYAR